jgi:hypothetical protein
MTIASRSMTSLSSWYRRIGCSGERSSLSSASSAARFSVSTLRSSSTQRLESAARAHLAQRVERRGQRAVELGGDRARVSRTRLGLPEAR